MATSRATLSNDSAPAWATDYGRLTLLANQLAEMGSRRQALTFTMAADRFAQQYSTGTIPDLVDVFEAAVKDTAL